MTSRTIKILGSVVIAIIVIIGIIVAVVPLISIVQSSPEIAAAQQQNQSLQQQVQQLQSAKSQAAAVTKLADQLNKKFPQAADVPGLIQTISSAAVSSGIPATNITSFGFSAPSLGAAPSSAAASAPAASGATVPSTAATPAPGSTTAASGTGTSASGQYASLGVNLTVLGNTNQFARFMNNLKNMDRSFSISNFSIAASGQNSTLTLAGTTYLYKAVQNPDAAASAQ